MKRNLVSFWILIATLCVFSVVSYAQETTGGVQGVVKDPSGAVINGATVEASSPVLIGTRKATTDSAGYFQINNLPPGMYDLVVTAQGFTTTTQKNLKIVVGNLPMLMMSMKVGGTTETVEVSGEAEIVDVTQSKVSVNVEHQVMQALPKGRSFQSLIPFAPGARQEPMQGSTTSRDNGFQIDGASDSENVYMIDGINTTNIQNGGVGKSFQTDFIQEVQIKSSSFEAEFGGALGGVINAIPKHGSNDWHGELKAYWRNNAMNANDNCASGYTSSGASTVCGLRLDPTLPGLNTATRTDGTPQYYIFNKDQRNILEPGFELGGPIVKDRLNLFTSYIPQIDTIQRTVNFTGANNKGPRRLTNNFVQHNMYTRLDWRAFNALRLFGSWNYAYSRTSGTLPTPDSPYGQLNTGSTTDPATLRADTGTVNPNSVWAFGGDWTPTSRMVVSARYGYMFQNTEDRGRPVGTRYLYNTTVTATTKDLAGVNFPASAVNTSGFANIASNFQTLFDAYKRKSFNTDVSYYVGNFGGSHTFKGGYAWMRQSNDVLRAFKTAFVTLGWNTSYTPVTNATACDAIKASNLTTYGLSVCRGRYGIFTVSDGVDNSGGAAGISHALYLQDAWTIGHGLTLNAGIRFDKEFLPPYDPTRFPPAANFGFGDKMAPRIGGAYDLLHNGKLKLYASYGKFFDIMKFGLPRGSFGSDYWHDCVYAMDDTNFAAITPSAPGGHGCPASGAAPGVTVGRFIENVDFRKTKLDTRDPAIQSDMKPMEQHEFVVGLDWAITPNWGFESRYSRKRLDRTIEDMAITDDLGFYIGNPGTPFADVLHRKVVVDSTIGLEGPFCAECPPTLPAIRKYDGLEFRLTKRPSGKWFGALSYTYSKLTGNYSGLTDTDATDGGGGRHAPNNHRAFDLPTMTYLANGKIDDGPLATDRPHTLKLHGFYRLTWWHQETLIGFTQAAFQGSPKSTCLSVIGTSSACQWVTGRSNFETYHRAANGDFVSDGILNGARTPAYFQTDFNVQHEFKVSKAHENYRLAFEMNVLNLLNQRSAVAYNEISFAGGELISPARAPRFTSDPGFDWNKVMVGFNYVAEANAEALTLANRYGKAQVFQGSRNLRLAVRFIF